MAMELKDWLNNGIAALAFIASVGSLGVSFLVWRFLRYQTKATVYSAIMGRLFEINRLEVEKPALFEQLYSDYTDEALNQGGRGLSHYVFMVFSLYCEIHTQHNAYGLYDAEQMQIWEERLTNDFRQRQFLRGYWMSERDKYPKGILKPSSDSSITRWKVPRGRNDV